MTHSLTPFEQQYIAVFRPNADEQVDNATLFARNLQTGRYMNQKVQIAFEMDQANRASWASDRAALAESLEFVVSRAVSNMQDQMASVGEDAVENNPEIKQLMSNLY